LNSADRNAVSPGSLAATLSQALAAELEFARLACQEAHAACAEVDDLIWQVRHIRLGRQRVVFSIDGFDEAAA
jgi:hypothetical protein